jgi:FtsZ-interacting cell division protein ZipA
MLRGAIAIIALFSVSLWADLDAPSQQALDQTQSLLTSPADRQKYIEQHPDAAAADERVKSLTSSPEEQKAVYDLSAQVFSTTTKQTNGDVAKQKELLEQAQKNPEAFFNSLPADQQKAIRSLADDIEKQNSTVPNPK